MKRVACALLSLIMIVLIAMPVLADEITPFASTVIKSTSCALQKNGTKLTATAKITTNGTASKIGVSSLKIQEYRTDGWVTVASRSSDYSENVSAKSSTLSYTGRAGYKYRAVANFSATVKGVSDTASKTTSSVSL